MNERKKLANDIIKCLKMPVLNENFRKIAKFLISNMDMGTICDFDDETHCRAIYSGLEKCPMIACYIASYLKKSHFQ